jgi:hypothetical protein
MTEFKADDLNDSKKLQKLLAQINDDPSILDTLPDDELIKVQNLISPYGTVAESNKDDNFTCLSFTNLRKEYINKLAITGMVGYLYRKCDEYGRLFKDVVEHVDDMEVTEKQVLKAQKKLDIVQQEIISTIRERNALSTVVEKLTTIDDQMKTTYKENPSSLSEDDVKEMTDHFLTTYEETQTLITLNKKIVELEAERERAQGVGKRYIIKEFLNSQFNFNPDKHVRSSYTAAGDGKSAISKFIPPDDTFHNLQYYMDSNYEEIRGVAERIYKLKPDLDVGIIPYGTFATEADADDFVERNKTGTIASVITLKNGKWNFLESFKANRECIEAYRGTIVDDILEQVKEDTKLGGELTRDRALRRRTENIKESKPDSKMIREYMENNTHTDENGASVSNSSITNDDQEKIWKLHQEEKLEYENKLVELADEPEAAAPHDAVRINVLNFSGGGKVLKKSHFYSAAKKPSEKKA